LLRTLKRIAGSIVGCHWSEVVGNQLFLALEVDHVEVDIFLCLFNLGLHVAVTGLERNEIVPCISDLSLGAIQRQLKLQRIQLKQGVALGDLLIVLNQYLRDMPATSVDNPTMSAWTYALSVDMTAPPVK
jgi:hypothetical protein